jgi:two-component system sensor kinase FixL
MSILDRYRLSQLLTRLSGAPRGMLLTSSIVLSAVVAFLDWVTGLEASLGAFYILPVILSAAVLTRWQVVAIAAGNALLREIFMLAPNSWFDAVTRFLLAFTAYLAAALFVLELNRNRQLAQAHAGELKERDQLRREAEDHLRILAESSPAAILTLDEQARILSCNRSARELFGVTEGESIAEVLPVLGDALKMPSLDPFHTAAQCQGRRRDGQPFLAHTWFSTYRTASGKRLAAIAVDSSEETREREEQSLRQLLDNNRIIAGAVYHEIRNICSAISLVYADLLRKSTQATADDFRALGNLVEGLEKIASTELQTKVRQPLRSLHLAEVLDHLRIIIEPGWREAGGGIDWRIPKGLPQVSGDAFGLTQAFLNITQNSLRAARRNDRIHLIVKVEVRSVDVVVSFEDSGPGIADVNRLFQPFQTRSDHVGLGLYISRAIVRGYGGDLKAQPRTGGACFEVSLTRADGAASIAV